MRIDNRTDSFRKFSLYIERNGLFRNLIKMRLAISKLFIGQWKTFKPTRKVKEKVYPERYDNELLPLRGLRMLEYLSLDIETLPGVPQASDFDFLKKHNGEIPIRIVSHDSMTFYQNQLTGGDIENGLNSSDDIDTLWPRLQTFYIQYEKRLPCAKFEGIQSYVEFIRPALDFHLTQKFNFI
jgi:hypothetical protein